MAASKLLLGFLKLNGWFSGLNGLVLLIAAAPLSDLLFPNPVNIAPMGLRGLGIGLIGFAGLLFFLSRTPEIARWWVVLIISLDLAWVLATAVVLILSGDILTSAGAAMATTLAACVAALAVGQFVGMQRSQRSADALI